MILPSADAQVSFEPALGVLGEERYRHTWDHVCRNGDGKSNLSVTLGYIGRF